MNLSDSDQAISTLLEIQTIQQLEEFQLPIAYF